VKRRRLFSPLSQPTGNVNTCPEDEKETSMGIGGKKFYLGFLPLLFAAKLFYTVTISLKIQICIRFDLIGRWNG